MSNHSVVDEKTIFLSEKRVKMLRVSKIIPIFAPAKQYKPKF